MNAYALCILFVLLFLVVCNITLVPQGMVYVVERMGVYYQTWQTGLHMKIPFVDRILKRIPLGQQTLFRSGISVVTKENRSIKLDGRLLFQVSDFKLYAYATVPATTALENLFTAALKGAAEKVDFDTLSLSPSTVCSSILFVLQPAAEKLGISVHSIEIKSIVS